MVTVRRLFSGLLVLLLMAPAVRAQTSGPASTAPTQRTLRPDQMLEEAMARIDAGDLEEANQLLDKVMRMSPRLDKIKLVSGLLLAAANRGAEAISALQQYVSASEASKTGNPDYRAYSTLGQLYRDMRNPRMARRYLEQARRLAPETEKGEFVRAGVIADLADVEAVLSNRAKAIELANEAAQAAPRDASIQYRCAELLARVDTANLQAIRAGLQRGVSVLNQDLAVNPYNLTKLRLLQKSCQLGQSVESAQVTRKPNDPTLLVAAARAQQNLADANRRLNLAGARELVLRAIKLDPTNLDAAVYAAEIEAQLGGVRDALERLDGLLKINPEHQQAVQLRERIRIASTPTSAAATP